MVGAVQSIDYTDWQGLSIGLFNLNAAPILRFDTAFISETFVLGCTYPGLPPEIKAAMFLAGLGECNRLSNVTTFRKPVAYVNETARIFLQDATAEINHISQLTIVYFDTETQWEAPWVFGHTVSSANCGPFEGYGGPYNFGRFYVQWKLLDLNSPYCVAEECQYVVPPGFGDPSNPGIPSKIFLLSQLFSMMRYSFLPFLILLQNVDPYYPEVPWAKVIQDSQCDWFYNYDFTNGQCGGSGDPDGPPEGSGDPDGPPEESEDQYGPPEESEDNPVEIARNDGGLLRKRV
jgi:hypothetical protein